MEETAVMTASAPIASDDFGATDGEIINDPTDGPSFRRIRGVRRLRSVGSGSWWPTVFPITSSDPSAHAADGSWFRVEIGESKRLELAVGEP